MNKQVHKFADIRERIIKGVDLLADPVRGTMSPKGRNVIFQKPNGEYLSTNDGVTIARNISVKDEIQNAVISIMKSASSQSNNEAGDGTSTTILLTQVLIKEGFKLIDEGFNQMDVKRAILELGNAIVAELDRRAIKVKSDKDLLNIATISSNSDAAIAKDVVRVAKVAGVDGLVMIEPNLGKETEIQEETGFIINSGLLHQEFRNHPQMMAAMHADVPVFITDKRIYHAEEAEAIIAFVLQNLNKKAVVIVARDFIGKAPAVFVENHRQGICNILCVKDPNVNEKNFETLSDLATYLGGDMRTEKSGTFVNDLCVEDFVMAKRVLCDTHKTVITSNTKHNKKCTQLVAMLKKQLEDKKDDETLKTRIASLTNGMVTIKVGGHTQIEMQERIYRYEDTVNAVRAAIRDGYLVGGGVTMLSLADTVKSPEWVNSLKRKFCEANIRQIAINCGENPEEVITHTRILNVKTKGGWVHGYDAALDTYNDLLKAGVVDPKKVTEMAVRNATSVASEIISSDFMVLNDETVDDIKKVNK